MTKEAKRKEAHKEAVRRYAQRHKEQMKQYYQANKEEIDEYRRKWREEHKEELAEKKRQYYREHKEQMKQYRKDHAEQIKEQMKQYNKQYRKTPMGRALRLLDTYNRNDKKYNRGECTLTAKWIVENIFTKPCHYCGKEGWKVIGCDRIDNSLPHTEDNVVPCCEECNKKRGTMDYYEFIKKVGLTSPS